MSLETTALRCSLLANLVGLLRSALQRSTILGLPIFAAFLLAFGADPSIKDRAGRTAAQLARSHGYVAAARLLESSPDKYDHIRERLLSTQELAHDAEPTKFGFLLPNVESFVSQSLQEYSGDFQWAGLEVCCASCPSSL